MSDALLDVKNINGIPVKVSFTNENPPWWICAGGNNPVVSFKMHHGDFELGKNGCEIEDLLTAVTVMLTRQVLNRDCYNDPRIQTAIEHIETARKQLMIHNCECLQCSPGTKHVR